MIVTIGGKWTLAGDGHQITLREKRVITGTAKGREAKPENVGKEHEVVHGYYATLSGALTALVETKSLGDEGIRTVEDLKTHLVELHKTLEDLPEGLRTLMAGKVVACVD
jgi:hypothetical protein